MREHVSVMLDEVLAALEPMKDLKVFVDATLGLAGHSLEVLKRAKNASLIGFDQDPQAREIAEERLSQFTGRVEIVADNFRYIENLRERDGWQGASAILFDLGVSNLQITEGVRGFSFQESGPLDMRMDCEGDGTTALEILSEWSIRDLTQIFRDYGEDPFAYQIARGIVRNREQGGTLETTEDLVTLIRKILPAPVQRKMGGHPARKIFQALRISVNDEIRALDEALEGAIKVLAPGGKILVISYHSLEDRMVKKRFRKWKEEELGGPKPRKALIPTEAEVEANHKSRSAKLRIFEANY